MISRGRRPALVLLVALTLASGACSGESGAPGSAHAAETVAVPVPVPVPAATRPASRLQARSSDVDASRYTAIVEAASAVAPAVVSVNVIRTEQVRSRPRSFFEPFWMPSTRRSRGLGSGFIISADGVILTNDHVIRDAERIMVTLPDGRDFEAELVGTDQLNDVAVLRIEGDRLPVARMGSSENLLIGEWALAIGNPFGNLFSNSEPTVTAGVVSAVGRHITPGEDDPVVYLGMIQTDASINPGNSGGPLVNSAGEVIGVNSSIFSRSGGSEGLGFAIPIDRALRVADDLIRLGEVERAWLGFDVDAGEEDIWGRTQGVTVARVSPASPAQRAGVSTGDRIASVDGRRLLTALDFEALLLRLRAGESVRIEFEGRGSAVTLVAEAVPSVAADRVTVLEQMELVTVTPQVRAEKNLSYETGALIVGIARDLEDLTGLREDDVILQINRVRIKSAEQAAELFRRMSGRVQVYIERKGGVIVRQLFFRRSGG